MPPFECRLLYDPQPAGELDFSGAPEADADLLTFHHDWHAAVAVGEFKHLGQGLLVLLDVPKDDRQAFFGFGLPGLPGERSRLFAENGDLLCHHPPP